MLRPTDHVLPLPRRMPRVLCAAIVVSFVVVTTYIDPTSLPHRRLDNDGEPINDNDEPAVLAMGQHETGLHRSPDAGVFNKGQRRSRQTLSIGPSGEHDAVLDQDGERDVLQINSGLYNLWFGPEKYKFCQYLRDLTGVTVLGGGFGLGAGDNGGAATATDGDSGGGDGAAEGGDGSATNVVPQYITEGRYPPLLDLPANCISETESPDNAFGVGNYLVGFYNTRLIAATAKVDFRFRCTEGAGEKHINVKRYIFPWLAGYYPSPTLSDPWPFDEPMLSDREACTMEYENRRIDLLAKTIQYDMRRMAVQLLGARNDVQRQFLREHELDDVAMIYPPVEIDDVAIHFRCGDIFGKVRSSGHGVVQAREYLKYIPSPCINGKCEEGEGGEEGDGIKTIGIVTQPFASGRDLDGDMSDCRTAVEGIVDILQTAYPQATVNIRNDPEEPITVVMSRLILANVTIVSPSTFAAFPLIGTFGQGYFEDGLRVNMGWITRGVVPFMRNIPDRLDNIHKMVDAPFKTSNEIMEMGIEAAIEWLLA